MLQIHIDKCNRPIKSKGEEDDQSNHWLILLASVCQSQAEPVADPLGFQPLCVSYQHRIVYDQPRLGVKLGKCLHKTFKTGMCVYILRWPHCQLGLIKVQGQRCIILTFYDPSSNLEAISYDMYHLFCRLACYIANATNYCTATGFGDVGLICIKW